MKKYNNYHNWTTRNHFFENYTPSDLADKFHQLGWSVDENRIVHVKRSYIVLPVAATLGNPTKPHLYVVRSHKLTPNFDLVTPSNSWGRCEILEETPLGVVVNQFHLYSGLETAEFNNYVFQSIKQEKGQSYIEYDEYTIS